MKEIFQELNSCKGWDWRIRSFDGWTLNLYAGCSLEHSYPAVKVQGVTYIDCPVEFSHPIFRLATDAERTKIAALVPIDQQEIVVAIEAETMAAMSPKTFYIVAESWVTTHRD